MELVRHNKKRESYGLGIRHEKTLLIASLRLRRYSMEWLYVFTGVEIERYFWGRFEMDRVVMVF
jgi:hypothetical protein